MSFINVRQNRDGESSLQTDLVHGYLTLIVGIHCNQFPHPQLHLGNEMPRDWQYCFSTTRAARFTAIKEILQSQKANIGENIEKIWRIRLGLSLNHETLQAKLNSLIIVGVLKYI